jgi:hypothetical protein
MFRGLTIVCFLLTFPARGEALAPGEVRSSRGFDSAFATELFKIKDARTVAVSQEHLLVLHTSGTLTEWNIKTGETPVPAAALNATSIAVGPDFTWTVREDHTAIKWGARGSDQISGILQVAVGTTQTVLLHIDGTVTGDSVPNNVSNIIAIAVSRSDRFALALKQDGTVIGWGEALPTIARSATNGIAISAGWAHCLALRADRTVTAWGDNSFGQAEVPIDLTNVLSIGAGTSESWAVKGDGTAVSWGKVNPLTFPLAEPLTQIGHVIAAEEEVFFIGRPPVSNIPPPQIQVFQAEQSVGIGGKVILLVSASDNHPFTYQWKFNGIPIPNATSGRLLIEHATKANDGLYSVSVSNGYHSVETESQRLFVREDFVEPEPTLFVTSGTDSGPGTFREAIELANVESEPQAIAFVYLGPIYLSAALPEIVHTIVLLSPNKYALNITGANQLLEVGQQGSMTLCRLSFSGASAPLIGNRGDMKLFGCTISQNNSHGPYGAIFSEGSIEARDCSFIGNTITPLSIDSDVLTSASGGALYATGEKCILRNCHLQGNRVTLANNFFWSDKPASDANGGAVFSDAAETRIESCSFFDNLAQGEQGRYSLWIPDMAWPAPGIDAGRGKGGAIGCLSARFTIKNTTLSRNMAVGGTNAFADGPITCCPNIADALGGAIFYSNANFSAKIENCTIISNRSIWGYPQTTLLGNGISNPSIEGKWIGSNNIIAVNQASPGPTLSGRVTNVDGNLIDASNDGPSLDLNSPAKNGGFTLNYLPKTTSPAVDTGSLNLETPPLDQAEKPRPQGKALDIGAVESLPEVPEIAQLTKSGTYPVGPPFSLSVGVTGLPVQYQWRKDGKPIAKATNETMSFASATLQDTAVYTVVVGNAFGAVTSDIVRVKITQTPFFTTQPSSFAAMPDQNVLFKTSVAGPSPITFQWFHNGMALPGASGYVLRLPSVTDSDAGAYVLQARNQFGTTYSIAAFLSILPEITVENSNPTGRGSLGDALLRANTNPSGVARTVHVLGDQSIALGSVVLTNGVNLLGESPLKFKLTATFRMLLGTTSIIDRVNLTGGAGYDGGGAINNRGNLSISDSELHDCTVSGGFGGAIYNGGSLSLNSCTLDGNRAIGENGQGGGGGGAGLGGAIFNDGFLFATNCTVSGNTAIGGSGGGGINVGGRGGGPPYDRLSSWPGFGKGGDGGSIFEIPDRPPRYGALPGGSGGFGAGGGGGSDAANPFGLGLVGAGGSGGYGGGRGFPSYSGVWSNSVTLGSGGGAGIGGGVFVRAGTARFVNCTISQNSVQAGSGGSEGEAGSGLGAGIFNYQGTVELQNCIIADNTAQTKHNDLEGIFISNGHNLIKDSDGATNLLSSDITGQSPGLLPLAYYGGLTRTYGLGPNSPAINAATTSEGVDERGEPRDAAPDIGAFEYDGAFRILNFNASNGSLQFVINAPGTITFFLEAKASLRDPAWRAVKTFRGNGAWISVTVPANEPGAMQFYRVRAE